MTDKKLRHSPCALFYTPTVIEGLSGHNSHYNMKKLLPIALFGLLSITGIQAQTESGKTSAAKPATQGMCLTHEKDLLRADDGEEYWIDFAADSYAGGSGTEADPYLIETPEQLAKLVMDTRDLDTEDWELSCEGVYFKQTADIDLSSRSCMDGFGIGNGSYFAGIYDGNGYKIKGYRWKIINSEPKIQVNTGCGLFLNSRNATIKNITFTDYLLDVQWENITDCFIRLSPLGYGTGNSQFSNCVTDGTIKASFKNVIGSVIDIAGIIGYAFNNTTIDHCKSFGTIECNVEMINGENNSYIHTTGIVPQAEISTTIVNCTSLMDIKTITSGTTDKDVVTRVAGITGWNKDCKLYNNNNLGNLYGESKGGFGEDYVQVAGIGSCILESDVKNCWNAGDITRNGGIYGAHGSILAYWESCKVANNYYNNEAANAAGMNSAEEATGYNTNDMQSPFFVNKLNQNLPEGAIAWVAVNGDYPTLWSEQGEDPNPDANTEIENNFTLRTVLGGIMIYTDQAVKVEVYTFRGTLQTIQAVPAGSSTIALPEGLYIVKAGQLIKKISVK